jgi:hypothetical protein
VPRWSISRYAISTPISRPDHGPLAWATASPQISVAICSMQPADNNVGQISRPGGPVGVLSVCGLQGLIRLENVDREGYVSEAEPLTIWFWWLGVHCGMVA